ncbi:MAG: fibronectin type III domain-containing protein, partial [Gammaproteobacteria bacterium]|nr:fibronectin type III domain-containing protein [Gammaproteobacteria bacterium]
MKNSPANVTGGGRFRDGSRLLHGCLRVLGAALVVGGLISGASAAAQPTTRIIIQDVDPGEGVEGEPAKFQILRAGDRSVPLTVDISVTETGSMIMGTVPTTVEFGAHITQVALDIPTDDDAVGEDDSTVTVTVEAGTGYVVGQQTSSSWLVADNDGGAGTPPTPTLTIEAGTSPVGEGTAAEFTLTRSDSAGALTVNVSVTESGMMIDGTAPTTVEFADGASTATLSVATDDDDVDEPNSDVTATVAMGTGYDPGSPDSAMVTVEDDDEPAPGVVSVTIAAGTSPVGEGTAADYTLTRSDSMGALTVNVDVSESGMMISGTAPMTVEFADGDATAMLSVMTEDDAVDEPNSDITATVAAGTGYAPGAPASAMVTVEDDDEPAPGAAQVTIAADGSPVFEGSAASFTLTRSDSMGALTVNVSVTETGMMIDGTAPTTVTFADGMATAALSVATEDDDTDEDDSYVTATVVAGGGYEPGAGHGNSAVVRVSDNDGRPSSVNTVLIRVSLSNREVAEGADAVFTLYRRPAFQADAMTVVVDVTETGDVINMAPASVDFAAGSTTARLVVTTVDDDIVEDDSVVTARLIPQAGYDVPPTDSASVTVTSEDTGDDPGPDPGEPDPNLPSAPRSFEATPGDHQVALYWIPPSDGGDSPITGYEVRVNRMGDWTSVGDNTTRRHTVTGLANGQAYTFEVRAVNAGGGGAAAAALATPQGPQTEAVVTTTTAQATEGDDLVFTVERRTLRTNLLPERPVRVSITETRAGVVTETEQLVEFAARQETATLTVMTEQNDLDEPDTTFTVRVLDKFDPGYDVGSPDSATVTVMDDDPAPHVYIAGDTVAEDAGTITFTVSLKDETGMESAASAFEITVDLATGDAMSDDPLSLAVADVDYTAKKEALTFAPGDTEMTFTVDVFNDDLDELSEAFMAMVTGAASAGEDQPTISVGEATGTIEDNDDPPAVAITEAAPTVAEDGMVMLTVMLDAPSGLPVVVDWMTDDVAGIDMYDMAVADVDYGSAGDTLEFLPTGPGMGTTTSADISVSIMADELHEHDEQFAVTLSPQMADRVMGEAGGAVVTIEDDDTAPTVSIADAMASEADGMVTFDLTVTGQSGLPFDLHVNTGDYATPDDPYGMAMAEGDYADYMPAMDHPIEFRPEKAGGASMGPSTVMVMVTDDAFDEHDEKFQVVLSAPMPDYVTVETGMAVGTIQDDDAPPSVSVAGVSGDEASGSLTFTVSLSGESGLPISVNWMTGDSPAPDALDRAMSEGDYADYAPDGGMLEFKPHETAHMVMVEIVDDGFDEHNEEFAVNLSDAMSTGPDHHPMIDAAQAIGTIMDNDDPPTVSIADAVASEADGMLTFMLSLDGESGLPIDVDVKTGDHATPTDEYGMAMAGDDYDPIDATYRLDPHTTGLPVEVTLATDDLDEHHEQFSASLSNGMYVNIGDSYAVGTIRDDDDPPMLSISDATGDESAGELMFTISLSGPSGLPISAHWSTGDADTMDAHSGATADVDYMSASGIAEFAPGETEVMVAVTVMEDEYDENDESFAVTLGEGSYAMLGDAVGIGTIIDNDDPPALSVADATAAEGDGRLMFTVSLDMASGLPISVDWSTGDIAVPDGSHTMATAGMDYTAGSGALEFAPGATEMMVEVALLDDGLDEMDEQFAITLSNAMNATFADEADAITAIGTITDDDDSPYVSIADARDDEGAASLSFAVTLSAPSALPVSVDWATGDAATDDMYGMATADMDYAMGSGTLSFAAGQTELMVSVDLMDDALDEHDEVFAVMLSNAMYAMLGDASAMGTIVDNDAAPSVSIADASGGESAGDMMFTVTLDAESALPISVDWATGDMATPGDAYGMATADVDYASGSGMLAFEPGDTEMSVAVAIMSDDIDEHDEMFAVNLSGAAYATLADGSATGTIEDDDDAPSVSIADASGPESVGSLDFAVTLSAMSGLPVSVDWATASNTAKAGEDYENDDGTLTIAAGETGGTVSVVVVADGVHEAEETFHVNLSGAMYGTLDDAMAVGTITDDDAAPTLAISDASAAESDGMIHFTVSLTGATALPASVNWATSPGTATAGADYQTASGSLTFQPGESRDATVQVTVVADAIYEGPESFTVGLSGPS